MSYVVGRVLCSPAVRCRVIITWDALKGIPCLKMGSGPSRPPKKFKEFDNATENVFRATRATKREKKLNSRRLTARLIIYEFSYRHGNSTPFETKSRYCRATTVLNTRAEMVSNVVLLPCLTRIKFLNLVRHGSNATFGTGLTLSTLVLSIEGRGCNCTSRRQSVSRFTG